MSELTYSPFDTREMHEPASLSSLLAAYQQAKGVCVYLEGEIEKRRAGDPGASQGGSGEGAEEHEELGGEAG